MLHIWMEWRLVWNTGIYNTFLFPQRFPNISQYFRTLSCKISPDKWCGQLLLQLLKIKQEKIVFKEKTLFAIYRITKDQLRLVFKMCDSSIFPNISSYTALSLATKKLHLSLLSVRSDSVRPFEFMTKQELTFKELATDITSPAKPKKTGVNKVDSSIWSNKIVEFFKISHLRAAISSCLWLSLKSKSESINSVSVVEIYSRLACDPHCSKSISLDLINMSFTIIQFPTHCISRWCFKQLSRMKFKSVIRWVAGVKSVHKV